MCLITRVTYFCHRALRVDLQEVQENVNSNGKKQSEKSQKHFPPAALRSSMCESLVALPILRDPETLTLQQYLVNLVVGLVFTSAS